MHGKSCCGFELKQLIKKGQSSLFLRVGLLGLKIKSKQNINSFKLSVYDLTVVITNSQDVKITSYCLQC